MNPILDKSFKIPFSKIKPEHVEPGIREALAEAEERLELISNSSEAVTYENTIQALDDLNLDLGHPIGLAYHLMTVKNSPELREGFESVQPDFTAFSARLPLNEKLWARIKAFSETDEAKQLTGIKKRHLEKTIEDFKHEGADLPADKKQRAEEINVELSQLYTTFSNNVLDSTNAFEHIITDEAELAGLPDSAIAQARADAEAKDKEGYRFTLQITSYLPVIKYSSNRELRKIIHQAFSNRASSGEQNNKENISTILRLRRELAELHGYKDFADYRLKTSMVKNGTTAYDFVKDLAVRTKDYFVNEITAINAYAKELGITELEAWDIGYVSEKLRSEKFAFDDEELRPYFPADSVLEGMFSLATTLFGITIVKQDNAEVWHESVEYFDINDEDGTYLGSFYIDLFPREEKRGGAWMNHFYTGGPQEDGSFKPHLGLNCANFTPPQNGNPALLTHSEVETTFHEFGHLLHHMLSKVAIPARSGVNVPWDFVELPSQIMENWCWEHEALKSFAKHYETGEALPYELIDKMKAARTFMGANAQMRQLSFGTVDLALHIDFDPNSGEDAIKYGQNLMEAFTIKPHFAHTNFLNGFGHVFAGNGYAAGYYSYKWSEVLDADAFSRFQKEGVFNPDVGRDFVKCILSQGDSKDAEELYRDFMGRDPDSEALLKRNLGAGV